MPGLGEFVELLIITFFDCLPGQRGPLQVMAERDSDRLHLTLENQGRRRLRFAAVEGRDSSGYSHSLATDMEVRTPLNPGRKQVLTIDVSEIRAKNCQSLAVVDSKGNAWPVEGLDISRLVRSQDK